jgi:hypothetical protein
LQDEIDAKLQVPDTIQLDDESAFKPLSSSLTPLSPFLQEAAK